MCISRKHELRRFTCVTLVLLASSATVRAQTPDNAALLYYQAFLLYEKPEGAEIEALEDFRNGKIASNDVVTQCMKRNRRVIDTAVAAASITQCDWGYDYSQGMELTMPSLAQFRSLARLLSGEAKWQADQGNYEAALARCVTLRRMAVQACDRTLISYLVGIAIESVANGTVETLLGSVPEDVDALNQFKNDFEQAGERFPSTASFLDQEAQVCAMTMYKEKMHVIVAMTQGMDEDPATRSLLARVKQGDEAFFQRNRDYYLRSMAKVRDVLELKLPYAEMCTRLDDLSEKMSKEMEGDPDATLAALSFSAPATKRIYQLAVRKQTHHNAILTAIGLYIAKAQTGQLPDSLPADAPPDLFSDKPFAYTKTADGFVLRCQGREDPDQDLHEYEFKIRK